MKFITLLVLGALTWLAYSAPSDHGPLITGAKEIHYRSDMLPITKTLPVITSYQSTITSGSNNTYFGERAGAYNACFGAKACREILEVQK